MNGRCFWLLPVLCLALSTTGLRGEVRTWTDSTGKFTTKAEYVSYAEGKVALRLTNGKEIQLPLTRLSREDQRYVRELVQKERAEQKAKEEEEAETADQESGGRSSQEEPLDELDEEDPGPRNRNPRTPPRSVPPVTQEDEEDPTADEETRDSESSPVSASALPVRSNNIRSSVRGAVYRAETESNLKNIALAIMNFESQKGNYPTESTPKQNGQGGLSWRVAILPFLGEDALYRQFQLNESWDSEQNRKLIPQMPKIFHSPGIKTEREDGFTNYLAVVGPSSVIADTGRGTRIQDVRDGTSKTIMVVEADDEQAVIWTAPEDLRYNPDEPVEGLGQIWSGTFFAVLADGSVQRLSLSLGDDDLLGLFSRDGGELIEIK